MKIENLIFFALKSCKGRRFLSTFATKSKKMTIREWINDRLIHGKPYFSVEDIRIEFPNIVENSMRRELSRLVAGRIIVAVYRGFYVIVPPQYAVDLKIPAYFYIDQLMSYIGKPYYLSLLTAGVLWGAAHQRPQRTSVTTIPPRARTSITRNDDLLWTYRSYIPEEFLKKKNSETGTILYSNAELTAIDLIQYEHLIGGLSRAATVLSELVENTQFCNAAISGLFSLTTVPTIQRLGFVLDEILDESEQADIIHNQLIQYAPNYTYQFLSRRSLHIKDNCNKRWKIYVNTHIEPDDI